VCVWSCMLCCAPAGPVSALLQHLRDQEQLITEPLALSGALATAPRGASGQLGALEGAVNLRNSGLTSVPAQVWQVRRTRRTAACMEKRAYCFTPRGIISMGSAGARPQHADACSMPCSGSTAPEIAVPGLAAPRARMLRRANLCMAWHGMAWCPRFFWTAAAVCAGLLCRQVPASSAWTSQTTSWQLMHIMFHLSCRS
jgi:hypothetical protein